jgi:ribosomal protein S18 acetylase RimI-like enzyme
MHTTDVGIQVRPLALDDLDTIFLIDHKIRGLGKAITYENITTEHIFTIDRKVSRMKQPTSYVDLITGDVSDLLKFSFVASEKDHVRGFILGQVSLDTKSTNRNGEILIMGVHPDYWRKGVATMLVNAILSKFHAEGLKTVKIEIDHRDKPLLGFCEKMGFSVGHLIGYTKNL